MARRQSPRPTDAPPVHPAAAVWPELPDDELAELADSIRAVGLLEPLVTWTDPDGCTWLLDGRNRLAACQLAGVEPRWVAYEGDPAAYVVARNAARRHMTIGQRAMAVALVLAGEGKRQNGRWKYGALANDRSADRSGWRDHMAAAGQVLDHAPDLAPLVVSGATTLAEAHAEANRRKAAADTKEAKLARLAQAAPDLATKVREGDLPLTEAEAAARQRQQDEADRRRRDLGYLREVATGWAMLRQALTWEPAYLAELLAELNDRDAELARSALDHLGSTDA